MSWIVWLLRKYLRNQCVRSILHWITCKTLWRWWSALRSCALGGRYPFWKQPGNQSDWRKRPPPWHFFAFLCHGGALHYTSENLSVSWTRCVQPALRQWCTAYASLGHFAHKRWPKSSFWAANRYRLCKFGQKVAQAVRIATGFCRLSHFGAHLDVNNKATVMNGG